jgi:hypothetical protein
MWLFRSSGTATLKPGDINRFTCFSGFAVCVGRLRVKE